MRPIYAILAALAVPAFAATLASKPVQLWELGGFKKPESVVADSASGVAYVSNMNGDPLAKDGNGFLSKISLDGKMIAAEWVKGLNAPKGLTLLGGTLYAADIDELVAVDVAAGAIAKRYPAAGAKFLNDVAAAKDGRIFVSDMATNTIWMLDKGTFAPWLTDAQLNSPNGLTVEGDKLIVGQFGAGKSDDQPEKLGTLLGISLADKSIGPMGSGSPIGHIDGLEPLGDGTYLITDWIKGALLRVDTTGKAEPLLDLGQGSADLTYLPSTKTAIVPMMLKDKLAAYKLE